MIRCVAIDDEPLALRQIVSYISKVPFLELAAQCHSALEARKFLQENTADVLFCDINMPDLNGMDFIKSLQAPPLVVFTTAYAEYAVEGFKVDAVDYLLKPFGLDEFKRAANRVRERLNTQSLGERLTTPLPHRDGAGESHLFVKTDYRVVKISIDDIIYIEGMSEYIKIHLKTQAKPLITLLAMKTMEERLPDYFMRIHRSYIINLREIQEVNKNRVILSADASLPIGDSYRDTFNDYLNQKFLGK